MFTKKILLLAIGLTTAGSHLIASDAEPAAAAKHESTPYQALANHCEKVQQEITFLKENWFTEDLDRHINQIQKELAKLETMPIPAELPADVKKAITEIHSYGKSLTYFKSFPRIIVNALECIETTITQIASTLRTHQRKALLEAIILNGSLPDCDKTKLSESIISGWDRQTPKID